MRRKNYNPQQHLLTLSINNLNKHKLILTFVQTILYEIWVSRNNRKYDTGEKQKITRNRQNTYRIL